MKKAISIVLSLILILCLAGCSAESGGSYDSIKNESAIVGDIEYSGSADYDAMEPSDKENITSNSSNDTQSYLESQKLIYTCDIEMQTIEFQNTINSVRELIQSYDGFVESEKVSDDSYNWYYSDYQKHGATLSASITIRIPSEKYKDFLSALDGHGKIMSKSENVKNITKQYNETASNIAMLEQEEKLLLEMMSECTTISDMIVVEERLADVQRQLANYNNNLNSMDSSIAFSTITMRLTEVMEYTPDVVPEKNFVERLWETIVDSADSFSETAEEVFFFLIYAAPYIIIAVIIFVIVKIRRNKKKVKNATVVMTAKQNNTDTTQNTK